MVRYSKYYRLTRTFGIQATRYGSLGCDGSNHGAGNATSYGTNCERPHTIADSFVISRPSTDVNVHLWDLGEYQERHADFPLFIDPDWIKGHLAMTTVSIGRNRTKVWATVDLAKVRILHMASDLNHNLRL